MLARLSVPTRLVLASTLLISSLAFADESVESISAPSAAPTAAQASPYARTETDSEYLFLPARGTNAVQINYAQSKTPTFITVDPQNGPSTAAESRSTDYDFHFVRNISTATYFNIDAGFASQEISGGDVNLKSQGLKDVGFGITGLNMFMNWNLVYGGQFTFSPGGHRDAQANGLTGNQFSGGTSVSPFIAFETVSHTAVWGMRAAGYYGSGVQSNLDQPSRLLSGSIFYEIPVIQTARVGFSAGAGRDPNGAASSGSLSSVFNNYSAGAYAKVQLPGQADVLVRIRAANVDTDSSSVTTTEASLGLRKTL